MTDYKLVPIDPTPEMVEAAEDAYMPFGDMEMAIRMAVLAAPAVQGEPVPEGCALIKLDSRTGKPLVTSEMRAKHIGEYWWDEEAPYYDENGDLHDHVARHVVPWSLCKEIYKSMAKSAMLSAQHAEQQPAPGVAGLVEALEIARDYVFSSLEEKKLALAGYPQMWRGEQDDLAMIDATIAAHRKQQEPSHDNR